ncbi:hypothetical protein J6590_078144 [Homalodisca vitripennis]|nr:hypothetical protein J6590_078144 [Homalodisca vitripennis]
MAEKILFGSYKEEDGNEYVSENVFRLSNAGLVKTTSINIPKMIGEVFCKSNEIEDAISLGTLIMLKKSSTQEHWRLGHNTNMIFNSSTGEVIPLIFHLPLGIYIGLTMFFVIELTDNWNIVIIQGPRSSSHQVKPILIQSPVTSMVLTPVVEEEVDRIIQQLPSKRSNDTNLMPMWLIKHCSKHIVKHLTVLVSPSFHIEVFPSL